MIQQFIGDVTKVDHEPGFVKERNPGFFIWKWYGQKPVFHYVVLRIMK
ncbi:hypothetical protein [Spirosoma daeguense]